MRAKVKLCGERWIKRKEFVACIDKLKYISMMERGIFPLSSFPFLRSPQKVPLYNMHPVLFSLKK